jgi:ABC-type antimicrobial peptide transport system ATPase subunit
MQSVPLPTYVGQWSAKVFWLKQTAEIMVHSIKT